MDQFRQVGEVLGSLKALMVLKDDISINGKQCCLLLEIFCLAFETIAEEIRQNLKLEEKNIKWKALEHPMRELHRIFKGGELYIRQCSDIRDWWGKAITLHQNKDCVEFHIHNLLCCFPIVIEAIEAAGEISGLDQDDMQKRRQMLMRKYDWDWNDPKLFQWRYGRQYLVPREICSRLDSAWREDRWLLLETIREKKSPVPATLAKHEQRLGDLLLKKLNVSAEPFNEKLLPSWILIGAKDYHVKRRLGSGANHFKEIHWLGESFALRHFFGEIEPLNNEISLVLSLSHPNIMQYLCGFYDEERKEGFLVMELMNKNLGTHVKENCGQRKRIPFSLPVAVDVMLQIARGMEYLHSRKIYHGNLNPSNILLKARNSSTEGYFYAKITGFGLISVKNYTSRNSSNQNGANPGIWYAPEVLAEQEHPGSKYSSKYTEKADVYSFGMLCFEILTGKIPFEEGHLQEDKMGRNIRAGERPLFPFTTLKYLANLTKKCWQTNPIHRPGFSSICRILRYIKKCLVINPDLGGPESPPQLVDFCDIEAGYSKKFPGEGRLDLAPVSQIPFEMFSYRLVEKEKISGSFKDKSWDLAHESASMFGDENGIATEDVFLAAIDQRSVCSEVQDRKTSSRMGADQRSVCSEAPFRRTDQGSLRSEIPWRKIYQRSIGFETPERKTLLRTATYQTLTGSETPERKFLSTTSAEQSSNDSEISEKKSSSTIAANQSSVISEIAERKTLPITAVDQTSVCSEIREKTTTSSTTKSDQKSVCSEIPEKKTLIKAASDPKSICSQIPEGKVLPPIAKDQRPVCYEIPEKKVVSRKAATNERPVGSEIPEKNVLCKKKLTDAKTSKGPGTPKGYSPRSSPTRTPKGHIAKSSPRSPLNPCARCSRIHQESRLTMSPSRRRRDHIADSEMA
uniref:Protein kinase domain-containing protein n=1 Tax=Davidia involucrata TaxID=16924 RepID=A0A5B6ZSF4_DAVIN